MAAIRITTKRQATLPKALCLEMRIRPGDRIEVQGRSLDGERVWVLMPLPKHRPDWFGKLRKYAKGKSHSLSAIRRSIEQGRKKNG